MLWIVLVVDIVEAFPRPLHLHDNKNKQFIYIIIFIEHLLYHLEIIPHFNIIIPTHTFTSRMKYKSLSSFFK